MDALTGSHTAASALPANAGFLVPVDPPAPLQEHPFLSVLTPQKEDRHTEVCDMALQVAGLPQDLVPPWDGRSSRLLHAQGPHPAHPVLPTLLVEGDGPPHMGTRVHHLHPPGVCAIFSAPTGPLGCLGTLPGLGDNAQLLAWVSPHQCSLAGKLP